MNSNSCILALLLLGLVILAPAGASEREAAAKVRAGIERFSAGDFKAASAAFAEADTAKPDDAWIAFDRAAAHAAQGEGDKAVELFRKASLSRDASLAARAHYNLGCLLATKARALFGERPQEASPETRKEGVGILTEAVGHYRDCLRVDPAHADARYNLEAIRLWIKHMEAAWAEQDRKKYRKDTGLIEFLELLQSRQRALRSASRALLAEPDSPRRRQAVVTAATEQRSLTDEIEPLKEKIAQEIEKAAKASSPPAGSPASGAALTPPPLSEDAKRAIEALSEMADQVGQSVRKAADRLDAGNLAEAVKPQEKVVKQLDQILVSVIPFPNLLQKAINSQQQLLDLTGPTPTGATATDSASTAKKTDEAKGKEKPNEQKDGKGTKERVAERKPTAAGAQPAPAGPPVQIDFDDAAWEQGFLPDWSDMLKAKADHGLKDVAAAIPAPAMAAPSTPPAAAAPGSILGGTPPGAAPPGSTVPEAVAEQIKKQREAMKRTFEKAIELCPQVHTLTTDAAAALKRKQAAAAAPKQDKALKLLREIAEQLPKEDQQNDKQKKDEKQEDKQSPGRVPQQQKSDAQKQQQDRQKNASREQAEATLRKARERERKRQELEKQLLQGIYRPMPVEKDW